ncbi:MAG: FtsW/RodA/SpoVE family cell cycle protein [Eubacterium sp.]|nr:FtsW/RodA/SpoVE family cell cycle protein [Eubacterium sp.]
MRLEISENITRKYRLVNYHFSLIVFVVAISIMGIMIISSANEAYRNKQIAGLILGLIAMTVISLIDYNYVLGFYKIIYCFGLGLLGLIFIFGDDVGGATRWVDLGFIKFQPSEMVKILMILFLAEYLTVNKEKINKPKGFFITLILIFLPILLILKQPDLSTSIVVFLVCAVLLYLADLSYKIIAPILGVGIPAFAILFNAIIQENQTIISYYQWLRIVSWLYPEDYPQSAYQQQNSITAVGSGQLLGKGLFNNNINSLKNGNFISEPQTDFIFAVTGEELGFVGCCIVIGLLFIIAIECIIIGTKARNFQGSLICYGIGALIGIQSFVNICVVTGLLPNTGLPLPFVSYGLTSLVTMFAGIGFVLNVGLQSDKRR